MDHSDFQEPQELALSQSQMPSHPQKFWLCPFLTVQVLWWKASGPSGRFINVPAEFLVRPYLQDGWLYPFQEIWV